MLVAVLGLFACTPGHTIITTHSEIVGEDIIIDIERGEHWNHKLKLFLCIKIKTIPQIAVWVEDMDGNYIETLYVTERAGTQGWRKTPGEGVPKENIRRKTSVPYWAHKRGVIYDDGLYLPTKDKPLPDIITKASPRGDFTLVTRVPEDIDRFVILMEVNNSGDFNDFYTKDAKPGDPGYTGGPYAGGQPAVVYAAEIDLTSENKTFEMKLVGHSSPDGEDGNLYEDMSHFTTATGIIKNPIVEIDGEIPEE